MLKQKTTYPIYIYIYVYYTLMSSHPHFPFSQVLSPPHHRSPPRARRWRPRRCGEAGGFWGPVDGKNHGKPMENGWTKWEKMWKRGKMSETWWKSGETWWKIGENLNRGSTVQNKLLGKMEYPLTMSIIWILRDDGICVFFQNGLPVSKYIMNMCG